MRNHLACCLVDCSLSTQPAFLDNSRPPAHVGLHPQRAGPFSINQESRKYQEGLPIGQSHGDIFSNDSS